MNKPINCVICKKIIEKPNKRQKTCSHKCALEYSDIWKNKINKIDSIKEALNNMKKRIDKLLNKL